MRVVLKADNRLFRVRPFAFRFITRPLSSALIPEYFSGNISDRCDRWTVDIVEIIRGGLERDRDRARELPPLAMHHRDAVRSCASSRGTLLFLQGHVRSGIRDPLTQRRTPYRVRARARAPENTRVDNIFRVYSRQFSRGGVALIAVVHREFAFVPPSSLLTTSTQPGLPLSFSLSHSSSVLSRAAIHRVFVPRHEKRAAVRCYTLRL